MKSIIISSNCSGGGKSTFTLALIKTLMYLTKCSEENTLVGFFDGKYEMSDTLVNFGYAKLKVAEENHIFR